MPRNCAFVEAMAQDDELAARLINQPEQAAEVRVAEFSPEVEMLAKIHDRLGAVVQAQAAYSGARKVRVPTMKPAPRPVTAIQRARTRQRFAAHEDLVARVMRTDGPVMRTLPAGERLTAEHATNMQASTLTGGSPA